MPGVGKRVVVTGGSGGAGLFIIPELLAHGYTVVNADMQQQPRPGASFIAVDSTNLAEVVNATAGAYAIIHMAALASPTPPDQEVWRINMTGAWNVLEAAEYAPATHPTFRLSQRSVSQRHRPCSPPSPCSCLPARA